MGIFNLFSKKPKEVKQRKLTLEDIDFSMELEDGDFLLAEALVLILNNKEASTSLLQRKLSLGYNRAGRIIDQLEELGIVSAFDGSNARKVILNDLAIIKVRVDKYRKELALKAKEESEIQEQEEVDRNRYKAEIQLEMHRRNVVDLLGEPSKIEESVTAKKKIQKFYYGDYINRNQTTSYSRMIKLENDKVVGWKDL